MENNNLSEELIKSIIDDRKQERKWRIIRSATNLIIFLIFVIIIFKLISPSQPKYANEPHFSLVRLNGPILPGSTFSATKVIPELEEAFQDPKSVGVMLDINSPGGTVVQSALIHDAVERLKKQYNKKVIAVGEDILASGAYLVATAADKIYVNKDTITGSIGVIMAGFNFSGLIDIAHIKRVVFTSPTREKNGKKDSLDPFLPFDPTKGKGLVTAKKLNNTLNLMHIDFINYVKEGREHDPKFKPNQSSDLFSGDFWVGSESVKNGLTDHIGDLYTTAKKEFKTEHFVEYRPHFSIFDRFLASAETSLKSASIEISHKTPPLAMTP
jgi:protease IV